MELNELRKIKVQLSGAKPMVDVEGGEFDMLNGSFADYPWEQCIADQTKAYGSKDIAARVCGAIKAENSSKQEMGDLSDACEPGYEAIGTKELDGKTVPNCVPKKK